MTYGVRFFQPISYLCNVAPNLDRLAGVIEGVVGDVAVHGGEAEAEG